MEKERSRRKLVNYKFISKRLGLLPIFFIIIIAAVSCKPQNNKPEDLLFVMEGNTMGTTYSIKILKTQALSKFDYASLQSKVDSVLIIVNLQMSTYIDSSEISLFNKYQAAKWFNVSDDLALVAETAIETSKKSDGAFDITVGPLVNLWGFGPVEKKEVIPSDKEIKTALNSIGYKNLSVQKKPAALKKNIQSLYCDLSAIAKGFGVDKVAEYLESKNITDYLVEIGGEVRTKGKNHLNDYWKIGIETPDSWGEIKKIVPMDNLSMATSGDYRNYFEANGVRYSHTIDPRTGKPIVHKLASVTVIHKTCMVADAMATAINVLGEVEGYKLAEKENLAVYMIIRDKNGFTEKMTPNFNKILQLNSN